MNRLGREAGFEESRKARKRSVDACDQVDCYLIGPPDDALPGILGEYRSADPVTAWLCQGMHCLAPVSTREELQQQRIKICWNWRCPIRMHWP